MEGLKAGVEESDYCQVQNVLLKCLQHLDKSLNIKKHEVKLLKRFKIDNNYGQPWTVDELVKVIETMKKKCSDEVVHILVLKSRQLRDTMDRQQKRV